MKTITDIHHNDEKFDIGFHVELQNDDQHESTQHTIEQHIKSIIFSL